MMAGNPTWWNMHFFSPSLFPAQYVPIGSSSSSSSLSLNPSDTTNNQELPHSWSQLLLADDQNTRLVQGYFQPKRFGNLENHHQMFLNPPTAIPFLLDIKQEVSQNRNSSSFGQGDENQLLQAERMATAAAWSVSSSSPRSCVTSLSNDMLDFSHKMADGSNLTFQHSNDHSYECNSTVTGGVCKKAKVQNPTSQPPLKVRKEKLGDRISALHQLVSPFGKTDTASVLMEAIGYIRFLEGQIEALCSPNMGTGIRNHPSDKDDIKPKELRSKGLCLVPVSCTDMVVSDGGADFWPPASTAGC